MIRYWLIISLLFTVTYAGTTKYFIKFGSFKNLQGLEQHIDRLPPSLRTHVAIVYAHNWYIPFAYYTSNPNPLRAKVALYRRYFKDAHIAKSSSMLQNPLVKNYATTVRRPKVVRTLIAPRRVAPRPLYPTYQPAYQESVATTQFVAPAQPVAPQAIVPQPRFSEPIYSSTFPQQPIVTQKIVMAKVDDDDIFSSTNQKAYKFFSKKMLSGHSYYLAYKKTKANPALLIKVSFENSQVHYQPIIGNMKMNNANYVVEEHKLYMFTDIFTKDGTYSKLDSHSDKYFIVSSWAKGKKLNTLRYYYNLSDAKRYLGIKTKGGLADILLGGDYDDLDVDE